MNLNKINKNNIIAVTKTTSEQGYDFATIYEVFKQADSVEEIKPFIEKAQDRLYISWSTVDAVDDTGEKIPINEAIQQQKFHIERGGAISNEHSNDILAKTIDFKVMVHPKTKTIGILTLNKVFNHNEMDDKLWEQIKNKEKIGSSVGGFRSMPIEYETDENGNMIKILSGFRQNETAITENPANPYALIEGFSAVAKSNNIDGNFVVKDNIVYKLSKQGSVINNEEIEVSFKNSNDIKEDITKNKIEGDNKMEEKVTKSSECDVLKSAMGKIAKSEPLTEEEKSLIQKMYEEKEEEKAKKSTEKEDEKLEETEKTSGEEVPQTGGNNPESPSPEEVNDIDVAKTVTEAVTKALKEQENKFKTELESIKKNMVVANTPRPAMETEKVVKNTDFTNINPVDIALGKIKKSWSEIQGQDKKLEREVMGDLI
jgi:hypothetical protein